MNDAQAVDKKLQKELNSGILSLILLRILEATREPMYGYQIARTLMVDEEVDTSPAIKQGVIYPVLRSLESGGMLTSSVEPSVSGPPRRYYRITDFGAETFERWKNIWSQTRDFVDNILEGEYDVQ